MGNCIKKDSGEQWGGEYWGSPANSPARSLLSGDPSQEMCFSTDPFEETGKNKVLNLLINGGDGGLDLNQQSWRPALQSIPE
ncbi:hypothetical protein CTI12_AA130760 [Artemisia annua]|uniref:Uncharacterized protein n=1 Tax=Artemisia annua TaxID=35608 RepID=A0A2U1MZZ3_ARTAN|nr:hypothetical protein CTI12_AA130760 [Artemisia annua]